MKEDDTSGYVVRMGEMKNAYKILSHGEEITCET
jgi:hypothetical protein